MDKATNSLLKSQAIHQQEPLQKWGALCEEASRFLTVHSTNREQVAIWVAVTIPS